MSPLGPQTYIEISLHAGIEGKQSKQKIISFFRVCGIPKAEIVFFEAPENFRGALYTRQKRILEKVRAKLKVLAPAGLRLVSRVLTRKDWLDKWQDEYPIMPLGRKFILVPFGHRTKFRAAAQNRLPIYLDPKAAFGSGLHPSTQIMISFIEHALSSPAKAFGEDFSCLDLGTGTGILSVAAHRLGAQKIAAYDFDAVAVQAAKFNLKFNGAKNFSVRRQNVTRLHAKREYDLVCANLTAGVLGKAKRFVFGSVKKGGVLIVSGILSREIEAFQKGFCHREFRCLKAARKGGWSGLSFSRSFR